jgi:multiple sugar transport system substrate-binding protein
VKEKGIDLDRYPGPFLHSGRVEGRLIGLPMRCHVQLLFYRKDLFEQAGMKPPNTWAEVVEAGKAIQAKSNVPGIAMYYGKNGGQNLMIWYNFLWGKGADVFDDKGQPAFTTPAAIEATQDYLDLFLKHKVTPAGSSAFGEGDGVNAFNQGNAAMVPVWWWVYSRFTDPKQTKLTPDQIGFAPLPGYGSGPRTTYTNAWFFGLSKNSKRKDAGMEFIAWLTGPDVEKDVLLDPKSTDVVATQWTNLADEAVNKRFGGMHRFAADVLKTTTKNVTYSALWPQIMDVLESSMNELATTGKPVKPALEATADQVRRIIRRG